MTEAPAQPTVLVVDDEEDLRDIMRRMLERRGFRALVAGNSEQALEICRSQDGAIDILVTDLGLPGVSGGELAHAAAELRPTMAVVYVSGLLKEIAVDQGLIPGDAVLIKKPFTSDVLIDTLHTVISGEAPSTA
ncbi:response regulator receiver domain-containing protein [Krasilnikovia cinnamomea]|uniref:Response regulator receiver domain-containing protein n=1 Tax=Krasilnikovia cinnamomea TaxID=349313 RepID=A0A4Q7ZIX0_9ACTN|nr:response regulator [Krasilnikovia cinnamomea]RZU50434.1 response regulator receiver domain-containing protein [Krasilnikovia cinnamomea]